MQIPPTQVVKLTSHGSKNGWIQEQDPQEPSVDKENPHFTEAGPGGRLFNHAVKVSIAEGVVWTARSPEMARRKGHFPQTQNPSPLTGTTPDKAKLRDIWQGTLQNCQDD